MTLTIILMSAAIFNLKTIYPKIIQFCIIILYIKLFLIYNYHQDFADSFECTKIVKNGGNIQTLLLQGGPYNYRKSVLHLL